MADEMKWMELNKALDASVLAEGCDVKCDVNKKKCRDIFFKVT